MEDFLKKFIYTGVGWISLTGEKFKNTIDNFIEEGKMSEKDGKKNIDEFFKNAETKKDEMEEQLNSLIDKLINKFSFADKDEISELENRISELEKELKKKSTTKTTAKKSTTKKAVAKKTASKKTTTKKTTSKTKKAKSSGKDSEQKAN